MYDVVRSIYTILVNNVVSFLGNFIAEQLSTLQS